MYSLFDPCMFEGQRNQIQTSMYEQRFELKRDSRLINHEQHGKQNLKLLCYFKQIMFHFLKEFKLLSILWQQSFVFCQCGIFGQYLTIPTAELIELS